jgi:hypothetical protein
MFTLLDDDPSDADRVGLMAKRRIVDLRCMVHRSNDTYFRMMPMDVKYFLCAAQCQEILDKTRRYEMHMT